MGPSFVPRMRGAGHLARVYGVRRSTPQTPRACAPAVRARAFCVVRAQAARAQEPAHQLLNLLRTSEHTAADRVWALYLEAIHDRPQELSDGSVRIPRTLSATEHRDVLHALVPYAAPHAAYVHDRARLRSLRTHAQHAPLPAHTPMDLSTPQELAPRAPRVPLQASDARVYLSRAKVLLSNMRVERDGVHIGDYNHALEVLAHHGHFPEMKVLWDELVTLRTTTPTLAPTHETYDVMMRGLFVHAQRHVQELRYAYGHALLPTPHLRRQAQKTAAEGHAAKAVQSAVQSAARDATMLIQDMQVHAVRPSTLTLDLAARVLRITGQLPALLALLRTGFGVDIAMPDANRGDTTPPCVPTTHTLNTVLLALGEHATVPNMVSAYETMTQPLPVPDAEQHAVERYGAVSRSVQPNTKTFGILLKHACTAPDTLFLAAALVPARRSLLARFAARESVGLSTQHERQEEIRRRDRGDYMSIARYLLDECMDRYAAQLAAMCAQLHVEAPALAFDTQAANAALTEAQKRWRTHTEPDMPVPLPEAQVHALEGVRVFVPPSVGVSLELVYPLVSLASRRRSTAQLRWIRERLNRMVLLKAIEAHAVQCAAHRLTEWPTIAGSLEAHHARMQREIVALQWLRFERLPARHAALIALHKERNARRMAKRAAHAAQRRSRRSRRVVEAHSPVLSDSAVVA